MKKLFLLLALAGVMVACGDKKENKKDEAAKANTENVDENKKDEAEPKADTKNVKETNSVDALVKKTVKAVEAVDTCVGKTVAATLEMGGIAHSCGKLVDNIINRQGTGICPFEAAVLHIHTPEEALIAIRAKMAQMNITL